MADQSVDSFYQLKYSADGASFKKVPKLQQADPPPRKKTLDEVQQRAKPYLDIINEYNHPNIEKEFNKQVARLKSNFDFTRNTNKA